MSTLKIRKGMKYRLDPNTAQISYMVIRAVWNKALALTKDRLERKTPIMWRHELEWNLTHIWKKSDEMNWLNTAPSQCRLQCSKEHFSIMAAGHCRFSLWSGCVSNHNEAGTSISIMLIESPEFIRGEDVKNDKHDMIHEIKGIRII